METPEERMARARALLQHNDDTHRPDLKIVDLDYHHLSSTKKWLSLFGLPVEEGDYSVNRVPWVSLSFVIACLWVASSGEGKVLQYAFDPTRPFQNLGLNFFSYSLAHSGLLHLIGNLFFLWPFMDNVEEHLGHLKTFSFIFVSAIVSSVLHFIATPSTLPLVGASGVCFAMAALYCFKYPKNRFLISLPLVGIFAFKYRLRLKARTLFIYYIALELLGLLEQSAGMTTISHWGHLGGAIAGYLFYRAYRDTE